MFAVLKIKLCYTIDKYGKVNEKKTFKGYHETERLLETYNYFKLKGGETVSGQFLSPWERSFASGLTIDTKNSFKEFKSKSNELKGLPSDECGNMLPHYFE